MLDAKRIKRLAAEVGFDLCGVTSCRRLTVGETRFRAWLEQGFNAGLAYLERNLDKRFDPRLLVEGAATVVSCAVSYKNTVSEGYPDGFPAKIASYACAADYHTTLKTMLRTLFARLRETCPALEGRAFVDTAPLLEKQLAVEAGLGWIGRQSLLITPRFGSFVVLGELVLCDEADHCDRPLETAGCGSCRRCVESCPAGAIGPERMIDARRCISCHTIERTTAADVDLHGWVFGCDLCQSCCPYNRRAPHHSHPAFDPLFDPREITPDEWEAMDEQTFTRRFGRTAMTRSGLEQIRSKIGKERK